MTDPSPPKKSLLIAYWVLTGLFCFGFGAGGVLDLTGDEGIADSMTALGYPIYLMTLLGVAKLLGIVAILAPKFPRLKEWAYAGAVFELVGASYSHLSSGDGAKEIIIPLVFVAVAMGSYFLRPPGRRLTDLPKAS